MSLRTTGHNLEEKIQAVKLIVSGEERLSKVSNELNISRKTLETWVYKYKAKGIDGLKESRTHKKYPEKLKLQAIKEYQSGKYSLLESCRKYEISDTTVLRGWIKRYTSGESLKYTSKGRTIMTKGRKTTYQERIEITQYCIAINKNYRAAAEKHDVSYQQVYHWVQKYEKNGLDGLVDRRGHNLASKSNLTLEEELQLKLKELEQRNKYLEAEVGLLKKLKEIERRENLPE